MSSINRGTSVRQSAGALALTLLLPMAGRAASPASTTPVLPFAQARAYVERFNAEDRETFQQNYPNSRAWEFLSANMPRFECPDADIERTYYFRWWTFRKHLKETPEGWVVTEFLPAVPWAKMHNTISCGAAHHFREGRWLRGTRFLDDYARFWLTKDGPVRNYSFWVADSLLTWSDVTGSYATALELLPRLVANYVAWEKERLDPVSGLFWQIADADGMEGPIGGHGFRPTINSYMYGDALAIARLARKAGNGELERTYLGKATRIKALVQERLWHPEHAFFEVRKGPASLAVAEWRVNDDAALTRRAVASASGPGSVAGLNDGGEPKNSWEPNGGRFVFEGRVGTAEWLRYEFTEPVTLSSVGLYLMTGHRFAPPESVRARYRSGGQWHDVAGATGTVDQINRWNRIPFTPCTADAVQLDLRLSGFTREALPLRNVRELLGYVPWYFNLPDARFSGAWSQLTDSAGFAAPWGLTTAEQRHPDFKIRYDGHECLWNGPVWPFATSQTLTALANVLNDYQQDVVQRSDYFATLQTYPRSHQLTLADGRVVPWIDENMNPFTGDWIARTRILEFERTKPEIFKRKGGTTDRGKDYNHSTFCDLVISGLVGIRPSDTDDLVVSPLVPEGKWDWFCLEDVPYRGRLITVLWDKSGTRYGKGAGLRVFADGRLIASGDALTRVTGKLP